MYVPSRRTRRVRSSGRGGEKSSTYAGAQISRAHLSLARYPFVFQDCLVAIRPLQYRKVHSNIRNIVFLVIFGGNNHKIDPRDESYTKCWVFDSLITKIFLSFDTVVSHAEFGRTITRVLLRRVSATSLRFSSPLQCGSVPRASG